MCESVLLNSSYTMIFLFLKPLAGSALHRLLSALSLSLSFLSFQRAMLRQQDLAGLANTLQQNQY